MPLVRLYNIDVTWFAVMYLVTLQTSYLTPPMAPSIFYFRAIAPPDYKLSDMYWGMIPFVGAQLVTLALVIAFPALALWLPAKLGGL
jgi:TRAP-type mannitol/chloroaromatic compound transport system permease large subunit